MKKIIVIGAGVSGLVCAIKAKNKNNEVIILEKENIVGKKILVTGSGKCNYYNEETTLKNYHSSNNLSKYINEEELKNTISFYNDLGIIPYIKNGYYYPITKDANTIKDALYNECIRLGIKIINNIEVEKVKKTDNKFNIYSQNENFKSDILVIATGSKAYYKSTNTYELLKDLNLKVTDIIPSLVQLNLKDINKYKEWIGVRSEVKLTLLEENQKIKEEVGEVQLTSYGISGICIYNLTPYINRGIIQNKKEEIKIDFVKYMSEEELKKYLENSKEEKIENKLSKLINKKLINIILKNTTNNEEIVHKLKNFKVEVESFKDFSSAQVCIGGLSLDEVDENFEVKKMNNLYVIGELLDVDGDCGGYNFTFATYSGIKVGNKLKLLK